MKLSYDYELLIFELKADIREGLVVPGGTIWVRRTKNAGLRDYHPIVDWFYSKESAIEELGIDVVIKKDIVLEEMIVSRCLGEMEMYNRIL